MKAKLNCDVYIQKITIHLDNVLNYADKSTHRVFVEGILGHRAFPPPEEIKSVLQIPFPSERHVSRGQPFAIQFHAEKALCDQIKVLVETHVARQMDADYPRD